MSIIIDAHTHIFPPEMIQDRAALLDQDAWFDLLYRNPQIKMASASMLAASMGRAGINRSISFGFGFGDDGLCHLCNAYVLASAEQHPGEIIPFAVINPANGAPAMAEAESCLARGARGIGELMPDGQGFAWDDWHLLDPLMDLARWYRVPVMIHVNEQLGHAYSGKGRYGPADAFRLATHYPENLIILPHWGGGLPFYEMMPEVHQALQNVYYDTAASIYLYDAAIFANVLGWAPSKVLMGSDYPLLGQTRFLRHIETEKIEPDLAGQLLGANTLRLLAQARVNKESG